MKKTSIYVLLISSIFVFSCGNDNNKTQNDTKKSPSPVNQYIHPTPGLEIDNGVSTSPTETPLNMTQQHQYKNENGESIIISYTFDDQGNGMATITHPTKGELLAKQEGEAASNNITYKGEKGLELNVTNKTATLIHAGHTSQYTLINK